MRRPHIAGCSARTVIPPSASGRWLLRGKCSARCCTKWEFRNLQFAEFGGTLARVEYDPERAVQVKTPVQLILRPAAAKLLGGGLSTCKRKEKSDPDHPKPVMLSRTRIAYRADDLARYQLILQQRAQERPAEQKPGIADPAEARKNGLKGIEKRRQNLAKAKQAKAAAKQATAEAFSAASAGNEAQRTPDVPTAVPATAELKGSKRSKRSKIPSAGRAGVVNPSGADGAGQSEARDEAESMQRR
jgi:hypothetical protein